ncbi:long-chain-fatty-acid--CoA ligase [Actinomadura violacea]|uniref:Long-chain fatty acid--CoA ligase n=1 Tax=Actinomadura violacea TaxID=2819934 RepID=A0ABS3RMW3_9ACTN|nr:long-chain fatty acid--CoA ligase [Actinomadura violacea]MBO2458090.1 long-chain fatty acid--CoA ligase [Actinomadura violacea]
MNNTAEALWRHAQATPGSVALRDDAGVSWTYRTLHDRVAALAASLREAGVRPGDRVLLVAPAVPEFAVAYYGIHAAGAIAVTANTMSTSHELHYIGQDAGVALVLGWNRIAPGPAETATRLDVPYWPIATGMPDLIAGSDPGRPHPTGADDTAVILYTSGTTGRPKGAQLTHGNLDSCAAMIRQAHEVTAADRCLSALPLFHVYGQACVMNTVIQAGAGLSLLPRFTPEGMLALLHRDEPTFMAGVPTMWNALLHAAAGQRPADFTGLRHAASGGASLPGEVMYAFQEHFGCAVLEGYGLTETTGAGTAHITGRPRRPGTVGAALPGCEITVRDDNDAELPNGEVGEIHISGPVVMKGYWNRPDATAEVLRDGRLRTGDLGAKDADGDLRIVGRKKELVIRGGYNVYPTEVEEVLYRHPDIVEAAVVGVPDDHYGEEVAAAIAVRDGAELTGDELRRWAKQRLSAYKVPHLIAIVDELPKGPTGKILKRAITPGLFEGRR